MTKAWRALVVAGLIWSTPAAAQTVPPDASGRTTETQDRLANVTGDNWDLIGLLGLLGLWGLRRDSDNDGYTDDPI